MNDIMLNNILKDSIQQLKVPQADRGFIVQLAVVPTGDSPNREGRKERIEDINGYVEFQFGQRVERALKAYGEKLSGLFLLTLQSDSFFEQHEGMIKEVLDNPHARVATQGDDDNLAKTIQNVLSTASLLSHHAVNISHVYLTVYSWRTTPDILFDVQTIDVLSEVEKRLTGAGNHE